MGMPVKLSLTPVTSTTASSNTSAGNGRVEQGNFDTYPLLSMQESPVIEVHIIASNEAPGGVGEPGVPPIAPAVANALYAATGARLRSLPMTPDKIKSALNRG
jgi:isoquinoline 1-oxidoreductase beta subunit